MLRLRDSAEVHNEDDNHDFLEIGRGSRYFRALRRELEEENPIWDQSQPPNSPIVRGNIPAGRSARSSQLHRRSAITRESMLNAARQDLQPFAAASSTHSQDRAEESMVQSMRYGLLEMAKKNSGRVQSQGKGVKFVGEEEKVPPGFRWVEIEIEDAKDPEKSEASAKETKII